MVKFILELPEEAVAIMEQTRVACDLSTIEELVLSPFKIFIPEKSRPAAAVHRARRKEKKKEE